VTTLGYPKGMIRDEVALWQFVNATFGVAVPFTPVCPGHVSPWDVFRDAYWGVHPVMVVKASRAFGGKSFNTSVLGMTEAITLGAEVNILGGSGEQARRVLETMDSLWKYPSAPRAMVEEENQHRKRLVNGGVVQALRASETSVRGPHPQRLRIDEADEMKLTLLDSALGQPMSKGEVASQTLISSTHQHADGTMTECLRRQRIGWKVYEYCYRETVAPYGWLDPALVATTFASIPEQMRLTEYEGQEPNPENRAINPEKVEAMFRAELGRFKGSDGEYIETEAPVAGARYSHGVDWARKVDRTIIVTARVDVRPRRVVAFEAMKRVDWPHMVGRFEERVRRFGGRSSHDQTGIGDVVAGYLKVYPKPEGVILVGRERQDTISEYIRDCEAGEWEWPMIDLAYNEHRYASQDDVYGAGHLPDTMCAGALARRAECKTFKLAWASA
jgi:hypothetical protein